jgi:hypothetical protein
MKTTTKSKPARYWGGEPPVLCAVCLKAITAVFVDAKLQNGWWEKVDPHCHAKWGTGLGVGKGQRYVRQTDGRWLKTEG